MEALSQAPMIPRSFGLLALFALDRQRKETKKRGQVPKVSWQSQAAGVFHPLHLMAPGLDNPYRPAHICVPSLLLWANKILMETFW